MRKRRKRKPSKHEITLNDVHLFLRDKSEAEINLLQAKSFTQALSSGRFRNDHNHVYILGPGPGTEVTPVIQAYPNAQVQGIELSTSARITYPLLQLSGKYPTFSYKSGVDMKEIGESELSIKQQKLVICRHPGPINPRVTSSIDKYYANVLPWISPTLERPGYEMLMTFYSFEEAIARDYYKRIVETRSILQSAGNPHGCVEFYDFQSQDFFDSFALVLKGPENLDIA